MTATTIALERDPAYPRLKEFLIESTGLAYYANRDSDLTYRICRRLAQLDLDNCSEYLELLQGQGEMDVLVAEVAIGETYFFRHDEQFEALRRDVLPAIIERNRLRRRLSIWSAGCANGSELYSVSILLQDEFADSLQGWQLNLLGTDINRDALARARQGEFDDWALRATTESAKRSRFSGAGKLWKISPRYREGVSFEYHNLAQPPYPVLPNDTPGFDLILCRNVTIYFSEELTRQTARRLGGCLADGGWLVVGHAELNARTFSDFEAVNVAGATVYRKSGSGMPHQDAAEFASLPAPVFAPQPESRECFPTFEIQHPAAILPADPEECTAPARISNSRLIDLRALADRGEWAEADRECERMLKQNSLNPLAHFYHALILGHRGLPEEKERALRRAIYLDRTFALAHHHLGLLLQRERPGLAVRCFENVLGLCDRLPDEMALAGGDGISVAELRQSARMQMEVVRSA